METGDITRGVSTVGEQKNNNNNDLIAVEKEVFKC